MPVRIQLRSTRGWRKPEGSVVVTGLSSWANPFVIAHVRCSVEAGEWCWLVTDERPLEHACHADILLEMANS